MLLGGLSSSPLSLSPCSDASRLARGRATFFAGPKKAEGLDTSCARRRWLAPLIEREGEEAMRIYELALLVIAIVMRLARRIQVRDRDLARQMRRACASVALNMQEGMYSRGGNRVARFHDAMGSARETMACLDVCVAAEYAKQEEVELALEHIDHIVAGLYRLCHPRSR